MIKKLRTLFIRWRCAWYNHPFLEHRVFYAGTYGGPSILDEWKTCACGKEASGVTRTRTLQPFKDL